MFACYGDWYFNIKEVLWHAILFREAHIFVHGRRADNVVKLRQTFWKQSMYGDGGLAGLSLFYPRVSRSCANECAEDLRAYLAEGGLSAGDFVGKALLARRYVRYATDLSGAPVLPAPFLTWLKQNRFGRGNLNPHFGGQYEVLKV